MYLSENIFGIDGLHDIGTVFFLIAIKNITRLINAPKLINPPSFPFSCMFIQLSSTGKSDNSNVKNITQEIVAKPPDIIPIKTSFLFKIPCV